jgi:hypothetical protein
MAPAPLEAAKLFRPNPRRTVNTCTLLVPPPLRKPPILQVHPRNHHRRKLWLYRQKVRTWTILSFHQPSAHSPYSHVYPPFPIVRNSSDSQVFPGPNGGPNWQPWTRKRHLGLSSGMYWPCMATWRHLVGQPQDWGYPGQ